MNILHKITILNLVLLIKDSYSFRPPKHNGIAYFKTVNNVYLANPTNHTTSYCIYLAGETINIDIPTSVANVSDIINWKVVNLNKDQLMFVHNNKPQILINQTTIKEMTYYGEISDSIIAFGDNVALHVPTINNPRLYKPHRAWNYLELLYFEAKNESVQVIDSLPWLKDDDWKFIREWKMTDYIHFDDKLYLLIKRDLYRTVFIQEISIIRLCLDKGRQIITTATEIHYAVSNFLYYTIVDALFQEIRKNPGNSGGTAILFIEQETVYRNRTYSKHAIDNFITNFDFAEIGCSLQVFKITLMRYHLRSEQQDCNKTLHEPCSFNSYLVTSFDLTQQDNALRKFRNDFELGFEESINRTSTLAAVASKIQIFDLHFPIIYPRRYAPGYIIRFQNTFNQTLSCLLLYEARPTCFELKIKGDYQLKSFVNQRPLGILYVGKTSNDIGFTPRRDLCQSLETCINCIMYGIYFDCVWNHDTISCGYSNEINNVNSPTHNYCFKVISVSPLQFNSSSSKTLTIKLNVILNLAADERLVITAGQENYCINSELSPLKDVINCSMDLHKSGKFNVKVNIVNNKYTDVATVSGSSIVKVDIFVVKGASKIILIVGLLYVLLMCAFLLWLVYARMNKKQSKRKNFVKKIESMTIKRPSAGKIFVKRIKSRLEPFKIYRRDKSSKSRKDSRKRSRQLVDAAKSITRIRSEILSTLSDKDSSDIPRKSRKR